MFKTNILKKNSKKIMLIVIAFFVIIGAYGTYRVEKHFHFLGDGVTHLTWSNMVSFMSSIKSNDVRMPDFDKESLLLNVPSSKVHDSKTGKEIPIAVWDSWPVQNSDGTVANYHGYRIVIGLTSKYQRDDANGAHLGMYAQKISDKTNDLSSWQYLGNVFNYFGEGAPNNQPDKYLKQAKGEWSGSTTLMNSNDTTLRLFYANAMENGQALTTAKISVEPLKNNDWSTGLKINHSKNSDHRTIFAGDGYYYMKFGQNPGHATAWKDDYTMRDPHFVQDGSHYYLTFEGNTGSKYNIQGSRNFVNFANFGNLKTFISVRNQLLKNKNSEEYGKAYYANAAIGKLELDKNFSVKKVKKPMLVANSTNDELERPNLFKYNGKWYLFTTAWGYHMATTDKRYQTKVFMMGYVSDNGINGKYKPLNGNGLVLSSNVVETGFTYAYLAIPNTNQKNNQLVVTSFADSRTFAPSILMKLKGDKTKIINDKVLDQGALVDNGKYYQAKPQKQ